jgi:hypothetical protein
VTATPRALAVDNILTRRLDRAKELAAHRERIEDVAAAARRLDEVRGLLTTLVDGAAAPVLEEIGDGVAALLEQCAAACGELDRDSARFTRTTLTIGMIGRSGQGKSRLLQSLTGLGDEVIPAGTGGFMTGVPSLIRHSATPETKAQIEFHTEESFLREVLDRYYCALGLGTLPHSLDQFAAQPVPELPDDATTLAKSAHDHLTRYRDSLNSYRSRLAGRERVIEVRPDQIRGYVAQHDERNQATDQFRAVRSVRITTPFGRAGADLGRVSLIDLPGLGDTNLGDVELLRQALGTDVDIAVFVKRPDQMRYDVEEIDVQLYDTARAALPELPLERWSFVLLNQVAGDGGNADGVEGYRDSLRRSRIRVVDVVTADCSEPGEVAAAFAGIFEQLISTVDGLDRILLDRRRRDLETLCTRARALAEKAGGIGRFAGAFTLEQARFLELFRPAKEGLYGALEELTKRYEDDSTMPDEELAEAVDRALNPPGGPASLLPDEAALTRLHAVQGGWGGVVEDCILELRAETSRRFLSLEGPLRNRVEKMHQDIAAALAGPGLLAAAGGERQGVEFLGALLDALPRDQLTADIAYGLQFVCDFTLHYRGLLQHRVRRALSDLTPDKFNIPAGIAATDVLFWLEERAAETFFNLRTTLQSVLVEPMEAVFAVVEEFRDRALRAKHVEDGWQVVYQYLRAEIWPERFDALAENTAVYGTWTAAVETLAAAADAVLGEGGY